MNQTPIQSLSNHLLKMKPLETDYNRFINALCRLQEYTKTDGREEFNKNEVGRFLSSAYYEETNYINIKGEIDQAIYADTSHTSPIEVIIETKRPAEKTEMLSISEINHKALQELVYYFMNERFLEHNITLKRLIATNNVEWFVFDARDFERLFAQDKNFVKQFTDFKNNGTLGSSTKDFYGEIAKPKIESIKDKLNYTYFSLADELSEKEKIAIYKILSPEHLLKKPSKDVNELNKDFYNELLYIIGLIEVKEGSKKVIKRCPENDRNGASLLESTIYQLSDYSSVSSLADDTKFEIALQLVITWINRLLFLKLLESQLISFNKNKDYHFLNSTNVNDYDGLNELFFKVMAVPVDERDERVSSYSFVPYLNSPLFEMTDLENKYFRITGIKLDSMPIYSATVLKDNNDNRRKGNIDTLAYIFQFLDAYNFGSDDNEQLLQQDKKELISASVLGLIFEKINGYKDGSFLTPGYITEYICKETIQRAVIQKFNEVKGWSCDTIRDIDDRLDFKDRDEANEIINSIKICDPAVGSGHFLVSALNQLIAIKSDLKILQDTSHRRLKSYQISVENDELLIRDVEDYELFEYNPNNLESQNLQETLFNEKKTIIENCLFGVDLNPNSVNICRLRLWIELLKNAYYRRDDHQLETLPNIDINIKIGNSLLHRFDIEESIQSVLRDTGISIAEYKKDVAQYKAISDKDTKHKLAEDINKIKSALKTEITHKGKKWQLLTSKRRELYDLRAPSMFELTDEEKQIHDAKINKLSGEISELNNYFEDIKNNKIYINAFEWRIEFPEVLNDDGRFVGFDCIIGNPPYIQLQSMGDDADALQQMNYDTYTRTGDIYCLFYECGLKITKGHGYLCYITSNKWMRAAYGEALRRFFINSSNPLLLIDFAGNKIFDSATVDTNILMLSNEVNHGMTQSCIVKDKECLNNLSEYFSENASNSCFSIDSWIIMSSIEQSIKEKIERYGTKLKDWNISINYGIKTGCNDAFIIDAEKRQEILDNCETEDERLRTDSIIRPILRGRDIKRYHFEKPDKWIINVHNGMKEQGIPPVNIDEYPSIKLYLDTFWDDLSKRSDKGFTPYNLRNCAYMDDFSKPKIVWAELARTGNAFTYEDKQYMVANTGYIFVVNGTNNSDIYKYLLGILNSKLMLYYMNIISSKLDETGWRWLRQFVEVLPLKPFEMNTSTKEIINLVNTVLFKKSSGNNANTTIFEYKINKLIVDMYNLNDKESQYLFNHIEF